MRTRSRVLWFGSAASAVLAGGHAGATIHGITGEAIAIAVASVGLIAVVSLVFYEVGLSEDRERETQAEGRRAAATRPRSRLARPRPPRRPR
jgi:membrane protein implicated in regulation of membrane protease activity